MLEKLLMTGARTYSRVLQTMQRLDPAWGAMLGNALSMEERERLTLQLYELSPHYRGEGLWGWESEWFERRLPPPIDEVGEPRRILVGACGGGREAWWLQARGYAVDGFDPAPGMVERAAAKAGPHTRFAVFRYEDLAEAVLGGGSDRVPAGWLEQPYDVVILGWGSLIHVLDERAREALFDAAGRICPEGPILASFYMREQDWRVGRGPAWGARVGRAIARIRRVEANTSESECYVSNSGFGMQYTREQIEALAARIGREAIFEHRQDDFPHATLLKR